MRAVDEIHRRWDGMGEVRKGLAVPDTDDQFGGMPSLKLTEGGKDEE